jgi:hypothetical protein
MAALQLLIESFETQLFSWHLRSDDFENRLS